MIRDLDLTLKSLLTGEAEPGSELAGSNISFSIPDEEWQKKGNKLDLNVYLYDIRENRGLRTNERIIQRNPDGTVTKRKAPPRIDCSFLVTAWNKASVSDDEDKELQEHRLLSQVLYVLLRNPTIPPDYLRGVLMGQEPPLPMVAAQTNESLDGGMFWNTLDTPVRPSISCVITLSLDLKQWITAPMVIAKVTDYMQMGDPGTRERVIQIGGRVTDAADPDQGIEGAWVRIRELQVQATTDSNGYYTISNLPAGHYSFRSRATGYRRKDAIMDVPPTAGQSYDFQLTKRD
ncbi:MAG: DUF4255 domain-containing protein [Candidatus Aminicenantes bacterium]|nr:DUF4255 domain-containing protein [Candidatus Aminicenantes bacterium]NIM80173.1 DUF4255 domain-containing protein [Candidatus Aminicenantes bacterium]NIN19509.1 DUF4255 domain-containing protein [Candidatus Aminicenantes bacterium]NIN43408.1 DUF4255 domain-containing protein [Candidatus Aminicenantes bacterium]NIN86153.1 DUF4255 domain-containing protein [Candidatus Aminicenantes bacterium]